MLKRAENGGFWSHLLKCWKHCSFLLYFWYFLKFGFVTIKDSCIVFVYQVGINILQGEYFTKIAIFMAPSSVTSRHKSWLLRAFIEHLQFQICDFILIMLTVKCLISHITIWEGAKRPFILLYFILMISLLTFAL